MEYETTNKEEQVRLLNNQIIYLERLISRCEDDDEIMELEKY